MSAATGANFNRYWYANNNPYTFLDPDGMFACKIPGRPCDSSGMPTSGSAPPKFVQWMQASMQGASTKSDESATGAVRAAIAFVDMLSTLSEANDLRSWIHKLNAEQAAVLAQAIGWDNYTSGALSNPVVLKLFQHNVDVTMSAAAFRQQAGNFFQLGRGITEMAIERTLFNMAKTTVGREQLVSMGLPRDTVTAIEAVRTFDDFRQIMQHLRE